MANLDLSKQVGPLPLGAWVVVVGAGLGIAYYSRNSGGGSSEAPVIVEDGSGVPGVGTGPGWVAVPPPSSAPPAAERVITNNEEWGVAAINLLIAEGYDAAVADSAIRKYLAGEKLGLQEYALVRVALQKIGATPIPLPAPYYPAPTIPAPPVSVPKPVTQKPPPPKKAPAPKPAPRKFRYYTVQRWPSKASTLSGIASTVYGNANRWPDIYNANRAGRKRADGKMGFVVNPNLIYTGWVLLIP